MDYLMNNRKRIVRSNEMTQNDQTQDADTQPESSDERGRDFAKYSTIADGFLATVNRKRVGFSALKSFGNVFDETMQLILDSAFYRPPSQPSGAFPMFFDPEMWHFFFRGPWRHPRPRWFFQQALASPAHFDPSPIWAMFWALAKAEHEFAGRYVPFWSHEERLTGHLVSQVIERLEEYGAHWKALSHPNRESRCRIWYADTATARQERLSGSDLGVIVHAKFDEHEEYWKAAHFQAKKAYSNGKAKIEIDQCRTLSEQESLGYYLFYHEHRGSRDWTLPATVRSARNDVLGRIPAEDQPERGPKKTFDLDACSGGWDFATFLTFALADPTSDHGSTFGSPEDVVRAFAHNQRVPSRMLVVTLGHDATVRSAADVRDRDQSDRNRKDIRCR